MSDAPPIPSGPEEVTAEWLTLALGAEFPGARVTAVETLAQHSGTTGRMRLGLTYGPGPSGPPSVFVKLPPFDESQRRLVAATDMGRREARFYEGPAAEAPLRIPRAHFAAHGDEPTGYVMVLEDLEAAGCTFSNRLETHAEEQGGALVEAVARLHARFWDDPRFDGELDWVRPAMRGAYGAKLVDNARAMFADELPAPFDELCRLYSEHHERICQLWDDGERTLIHGDTHAGNQFIDGDQIGLYDWAVISRSPGIRDVAIYLGNSCPTEIRHAHDQDWLRAYRQVLVDADVEAPSFETLWFRYRLGVLYAWVAATTTASMGSRWQPVEVGRAGMIRATEACADLETLDAFGDAL